MKVKDILAKKGNQVWTVPENATIHDALAILVAQNIGALVVLNEKKQIAGIISERDIIHECYKNSKQIETIPVQQVMIRNLLVGTPDDNIDYIMGIMTNNRVRHVPILSEGQLQGIISIGDVVKAQLQDFQYENHYLKNYMFGTDRTA